MEVAGGNDANKMFWFVVLDNVFAATISAPLCYTSAGIIQCPVL